MGLDISCCCLQWVPELKRFEMDLPETAWAEVNEPQNGAEIEVLRLVSPLHRKIWATAADQALKAVAESPYPGPLTIDGELESGGLGTKQAQRALRDLTRQVYLPEEGVWSNQTVKAFWEQVMCNDNPDNHWLSEKDAWANEIEPYGYWSAMVFLQTCAQHGYGIIFY